MARNYYEILGVTESATPAEIEAAFRSKAREVHPDTVPVENTYLRKVAAEAFKDLSEAKAVLLDATAREKYDAGLVYERSAKQERSAPAEPPPSPTNATPQSSDTRTSSRSRSTSRSSSTSARTQARTPASEHVRRGISPFPEIKNLNSFLFMILGIVTIFSLALLVWGGRMPPLWLAILTACLGILSFVNGMRPNALTIISGRTSLILSTILLTIVIFALWLLSPSYIEIATSSHVSGTSTPAPYGGKEVRPNPSKPSAAKDPGVTVVDESGPDAAWPTRIWTNLKDGQNYRTRVNGNALYLDAVDTGGKNSGEIANCEFHRANKDAPNWVGACSERGPQNQDERKSPAMLNQFSDTKLEGSTSDIPVFVMTPVQGVQMGAPPVAQEAGVPEAVTDIAEPDLSGLSDANRQSIETTCASDKLLQGPAAYNQCVQEQMDALKTSPRPAGLSKLSSQDRDSVEFACTSAKLMQGPAAYNKCLAQQMASLKKKQKP
jgi:hypothetical protein